MRHLYHRMLILTKINGKPEKKRKKRKKKKKKERNVVCRKKRFNIQLIFNTIFAISILIR